MAGGLWYFHLWGEDVVVCFEKVKGREVDGMEVRGYEGKGEGMRALPDSGGCANSGIWRELDRRRYRKEGGEGSSA